MLFWQLSNIIIYVKIVGKIPDQHLSVWLFSNPGDKVQILVKRTGQICPVVFLLFWTFSPGFENTHIFKCWSGIFPTILTYMIILENCKNNISVYGCSPIQGTKFYSCQNLMKPGFQSETYEALQDCVSVWVSQRWTNLWTMIWKGTGPMSRHAAFRILKKNRGLKWYFLCKGTFSPKKNASILPYLLKWIWVYQLWLPGK